MRVRSGRHIYGYLRWINGIKGDSLLLGLPNQLPTYMPPWWYGDPPRQWNIAKDGAADMVGRGQVIGSPKSPNIEWCATKNHNWPWYSGCLLRRYPKKIKAKYKKPLKVSVVSPAYTHIHIIYIYIHMYIHLHFCLCLCLYTYPYIYLFLCIFGSMCLFIYLLTYSFMYPILPFSKSPSTTGVALHRSSNFRRVAASSKKWRGAHREKQSI